MKTEYETEYSDEGKSERFILIKNGCPETSQGFTAIKTDSENNIAFATGDGRITLPRDHIKEILPLLKYYVKYNRLKPKKLLSHISDEQLEEWWEVGKFNVVSILRKVDLLAAESRDLPNNRKVILTEAGEYFIVPNTYAVMLQINPSKEKGPK